MAPSLTLLTDSLLSSRRKADRGGTQVVFAQETVGGFLPQARDE